MRNIFFGVLNLFLFTITFFISFFLPNIFVAQVHTAHIVGNDYATYFKYVFKEFSNEDLYSKSLREIKWYKTFIKSPFKLDNTTFCNPSLTFDKIDSVLKKDIVRLNALHYYIDPLTVKQQEKYVSVETRLPYHLIYQPFYILNTEVTNKEYREFINYVKDSIARNLLATSKLKISKDFKITNDSNDKFVLNWTKEIPYKAQEDDIREVLSWMYVPETIRFYGGGAPDARKLNYTYYGLNNCQYTVNVYPDTLKWFNDFLLPNPYCDFNTEANMYNWVSAYVNCPVVGLTYTQIRAFLNWKTECLQKEINRKKLDLIVEFDLMNEIELEMISLLKKKDRDMIRPEIDHTMYYQMYNQLDLMLNSNSHYFNRYVNLPDLATHRILSNNLCFRMMTYSALIFPIKVDSRSKTPKILSKYYSKEMIKNARVRYVTHYNVLKNSEVLPFLNGNVSEWMAEELTSNDLKDHKDSTNRTVQGSVSYCKSTSKTFPFKGNLEDSYRLQCNFDKAMIGFDSLKFTILNSTLKKKQVCKLVKGANWYDSGDWRTGHLKKTFAVSDSAFSTVGFRYVVRFIKKS